MKHIIILLALLSFNIYAKPVNINSADAVTIADSLQGVGQKKAEAIIQYRLQNGAFKTLDELTNVKGIGDKTVQKNVNDIIFSEPVVIEKTLNETKS